MTLKHVRMYDGNADCIRLSAQVIHLQNQLFHDGKITKQQKSHVSHMIGRWYCMGNVQALQNQLDRYQEMRGEK